MYCSDGQRRQPVLTVIGFFGITRIWTGAWGLTSVNPSARSSSNTMFAGISLRIILPKILQTTRCTCYEQEATWEHTWLRTTQILEFWSWTRARVDRQRTCRLL